MKALYSLILASGTKEALFAALWLALDEEPGTFADVDFASLRATAARFGVALSESQVRKRVKELEKLDVLTVVPRRERGRFDLLVFQPAPNRFAEPESPKPEPATPLFDAAFGVGVESFAKPSGGDRAAPGPRFRASSVSAPVGRDALAQPRAGAVSVADAVSETETETEPEPVADVDADAASQMSPSEASRADALLARSPFADALRRAVWPKEYENIAWNVRTYRCPPEGFSDDERDAMDSRVCELYVESRRIADEFDARLRRGEYADKGGSERCDAEREAALRAFAATRNPAIAPTFVAEASPNRVETPSRFAIDRERASEPSVAADHFREVAKMIQTPEFAEVRGVRPTSTAPTVAPKPSESEPVAAPLEEINNNKYIKNKTINKPARVLETETQANPDAPSVADAQPGLEPERRPSAAEARFRETRPGLKPERRPDVADVRELVDFESPKVAALRREIVERVWEPTVHPDLIDRLTAAVVLRVGGATRASVFALIREARDERSLYERSNGRTGKRTIWQTATLRLKRLFENAGWIWTPTRFADEPRPTREPVAIDCDRSRSTPEPPPTETPERSVDELLAVADGFEPSELDLPFADFARLVARRRGIADPCESRGVALEIRNALRELAKRELATA